MRTHKYYVGSLAILTIFSLMLSQAVATQTDSDKPVSESSLILFNRLDTTREFWPYSIVVLDMSTGQEAPVTFDSFCCATSWSPDGKQILVHLPPVNEWAASSFWAMDADGRNRQLLTDTTQINPSRGQWTPDGNRIIFWARDLHVERGQPSQAIYEVSANGGSTRRLTEFFGRTGGLTISPDGSRIAFIQDRTLYTMPVEGGEPHELGVPLRIGVTLTWSPDGSQLAALAFNSAENTDLPLELHVMAPDGSNVRLLVTDMGNINNVRWSPDSSELLFIANALSNAERLGIVNVQTNVVNTYEVGQGVLESLTRISAAAWSPDGTQIAISGRYRENNPYNTHRSLYVVDRDVTQIQRLTQEGTLDGIVQWRSE